MKKLSAVQMEQTQGGIATLLLIFIVGFTAGLIAGIIGTAS